MKRVLIFLVTLLVTSPLWGQTILTRDPSRNQIIQVKTALDHLTVIQLGEQVLSVAAGSAAFKVEWRGNKVFIEPTQAGVSTNLFIWTKSGRGNYELEPTGPVGAMDFAIDAAAADPEPAPKPAARPAPRFSVDPLKAAMEGMLGGTPVKQENWKARKHRVQIMVRDLFEEHGELFIRFSIENGTKKPYLPGTPHVALLNGALSHSQLAKRTYMQLRSADEENLTAQSASPLRVIAHEERNVTVLPGHETVGVIGVNLSGSQPDLLRLEFAGEHGRTVSALVVI
jgi:hypothetical protein